MQAKLQNIPFAEPDRCKLEVYVPEGKKDFTTILYFYGGGMTTGDRHLPAEFADQEFAVVTPDYRLHPQTTCPGYIEDAAAAVAWTFKHVASFGGNPDKIVLVGSSAGAYLASMVTLDKRWLKPYGIDPDRLAALISLSGQNITHFTIRKERGIPETQPLIDELAPFYHIRPDAPPILLVTGDRELELMGRYEENAYFLRMLRNTGHTHNELHEIKGKDHGGMGAQGNQLALEFIRKL
ncbi:alpha/beta hydrolase [Kiritimatiellaeota bacterium B1221]|nr:alpha/beta hydrolase [Kiritimatiellaeota bacterium B1221]